VAEFAGKAADFQAAGAKVVFVYPGPAGQLKEKAAEFVKGRDYPDHFQFLLDPDYTFTNAYHLRWDAKNETAYPSTFVIDGSRKVKFAKVSGGHGDRAKVADVLAAVGGK
ncbi:MAG: peroxiredoxin family protein, partial [Fimbriiglobus sp.]